jgi:transposase
MQATDMRSLSRDARHERRVQVIRLRERGHSYEDIAQQTGLSRTGVFDICKRWRLLGDKGLRDAPGGRPAGEGRALELVQEVTIREVVASRTPDEMQLPWALWTRAAVGELIRQYCAVALSVRAVGLYLARWGFTPQKPLVRAREQSPAAVSQWLKEDYPKIAARARAEGAEIHWGDETGLRSDDVRGRGYAPRGQTPVVRVNRKRQGLSVISTVTNKGQMRWRVFDGGMNGPRLIDFMQRLVREVGAEGLPHPRQPESAPCQARQGVAGRQRRAHRDLLSAELQPRAQPRRDGQRRPQAGRHEAGCGAHEATARQGRHKSPA